MNSMTIDTSAVALCIGLGFGLILVALGTLRHRFRLVAISVAAVASLIVCTDHTARS